MNDLIIRNEQFQQIARVIPEYALMVQEINAMVPEITRATQSFGKSQSQFMDNMLTVSHPTPLRNARQILAEITRSKEALQEAYYGNRKKEIEIQKFQRDYEKIEDDLEKELILVEIDQRRSQLASSELYILGAVRKITNYLNQYKTILAFHGKEEFTEEDFEKEEERYHVMKAFDQALTAARARGGVIDEGNHIYLNQIGVNGGMAQREITKYLSEESKRENPPQTMVIEFLNEMAEKFQGGSKILAAHKGMTTSSEVALLGKSGD